MRTRRVTGKIALAVSLALVLAACGGDDDAGSGGETTGDATTGSETTGDTGDTGDALGSVEVAAGDPIKIAALQAISGDVASLGTDQVRAIELAIADRGGELMGHPIQLQVEDDECRAEGGTTGGNKIASDPQILGVIGTSCSGAAVPASQIVSGAGMVMISGSNTSPALTSLNGAQGSAWQAGYFRTAHNDEIQGRAAATFAFQELGVTKAASIHDGDPYTEGLSGVFDAVFEELGGEIVLATAVNKGDTDMRPVLTEIAAAGAELIFFPIFQPEGDFIAGQAKEIEGLEDAVLMGADGLLSDTFVELAETKGMYFSGPASPTGGVYDDLVAAYEEEYGEKPIQSFHAHAYDATNMLLDAIEASATDDGGTLTISRQGIRDALYGLSGFSGITGTLTCDEFGDCASPKIDIVRNTEAEADIAAVRGNVLFTFEP